MASQETIFLHSPVDLRDLGPEHVDLRVFASGQSGSSHIVRAVLPIATSDGIAHVPYMHPAQTNNPVRMGPGMIELGTAQRNALNLFCLGGQVTAAADNGLSVLQVASTAPILLMNKYIYDDDTDPVDLFVDELEGWLSILRARARGNVSAFERALLLIPPIHLYVQGLVLAARRLAMVPVDERSELYWRSYTTINSALKAVKLRRNYPPTLPNFDALLAVEPRNHN